jgi:hypothetical protein
MSNDSKYISSNNDLKKDEINSPEISDEHKGSPSNLEINKTRSRSNSLKSNSPKHSRPSSPKDTRSSSPENHQPNSPKHSRLNSPKDTRSSSPKDVRPSSPENRPSNSPKHSRLNSPKNNPPDSPKSIRSQLHSSRVSERKPSNEIITKPPLLSPISRPRVIKQQNLTSTNKQRTRSQSPRKNFSYLEQDRPDLRRWKEHRRNIAKQFEDDRIYRENRQILERLAKIAIEPSAYPTLHIEQERARERHASNQRRKVMKNYIPLLKDNLLMVHRLANVKGVYDAKRMKDDFNRHTQILKQEAANRQKARETAAQRPFILPKINLKS